MKNVLKTARLGDDEREQDPLVGCNEKQLVTKPHRVSTMTYIVTPKYVNVNTATMEVW